MAFSNGKITKTKAKKRAPLREKVKQWFQGLAHLSRSYKFRKEFDQNLHFAYGMLYRELHQRQLASSESTPLSIDNFNQREGISASGILDSQAFFESHRFMPGLLNTPTFRNPLEDDDWQDADFFYLWGIKLFDQYIQIVNAALEREKPLLIFEDGFLRSQYSWAQEDAPPEARAGISFTIDDLTTYYDGTRPSRLELMLNADNPLTHEQQTRARDLIGRIVSTRLTKYNNQPIFAPEIGRPGKKKVLVVDQSYGDYAIIKGRACDGTFRRMLQGAIDENPDADVIVKTHPDTIAGRGGYYTGLQGSDNVYPVTFPINPISLLETVDRVYVVSTQLGFEALMCGKEVTVFGAPFYAGWGLTDDRQQHSRRTRTLTLEELFHRAYIDYSHYIDPTTGSVCEIERAIECLLEIRERFGTG